jgi:tetratricopeptide (TPR) repeat protein
VAAEAPAAAETSAIALDLAAYQARMNELEERQRELLAQALQRGDSKERDRLQRELVIMNSRLALLEDSYAQEQACLQEVLATLAQLRGGGDEAGPNEAMERLRAGETRPAEDYLARFSERKHPLATRAAFDGGRLAVCRVELQQALTLFRRALEREPDNPDFLRAAGMTARDLYNYREAVPWLETLVRFLGARGDGDPLDLAKAKRDLAYIYVLSGQHQKAGPLYKEAMTTMARQLGQDHPEMAQCWQQIGELQETLGEYDKAVSLYQKALAIFEKKRGPEHPALAAILDKLAALCMELEMEKQAVPLYERLVRIREQALRPTHPQLVKSLGDLAESYRLQGQYAEAEACYRKSLAINETVHGPEHPSVAAVLQELAKLCTSQRKKEEAEQYQQRAAAIFQKSVEAAERKEGQQSLTLEL